MYNLDNWNKNDYHNLINDLNNLQDKKYRDFQKRLLNSDIKMIGIKTPILKDIAKSISKGNYLSFININKHQTYEEILIHGFILGSIKEPFDEVIKLLDDFILIIHNWAICDLVCCNLKIFKKNHEDGYKYINKLLNKDSWNIRVGLVLLLTYFINDEYIDNILNLKITNNDYYVYMAHSWLISICYIKYPKKTLKVLEGHKLDIKTHNKAISKICDSRRIDESEKISIKKLRR